MGTIDAMHRDEATTGLAASRSRAGYARRIGLAAARASSWLATAMARRRSRIDLLELTDGQLRDIGLTPRQARREGMKPFWE